MGTTTHASTLRSVSYTGHTEAAGVIALIRVSHNPRADARARPRTLEETLPEADQTVGKLETNTAHQKGSFLQARIQRNDPHIMFKYMSRSVVAAVILV